MQRLVVTAIALVVLASPAEVQAEGWWDVEHARMNALAGGPTNANDAWLLERYGCYSGTPSTFCHGVTRPRRYYRARRRIH